MGATRFHCALMIAGAAAFAFAAGGLPALAMGETPAGDGSICDGRTNQAMEAYVRGDYAQVKALATPCMASISKAAGIVGSAGCQLHERDTVLDAYGHATRPADRSLIRYVCGRTHMDLPPNLTP